MDDSSIHDSILLETFLEPLRVCSKYKPAFGKGAKGGFSVDQFLNLYGEDLFYSWIGLNEPLVYAAHKAAGGLTSVYRQLGVGCERLFRAVIHLRLELSEQQMNWSYEYDKPNGEKGIHTLDARIDSSDLNADDEKRLVSWLSSALSEADASATNLRGVIFEVRQGYKSADSKRQNADLRYGMRAYQASRLPAFILMSSQISEPVVKRYRSDGMIVLTGLASDDPTESTFAFCEQVIGYDLSAFFERNTEFLRSEIGTIVGGLLTPR